MEFEGKFRGSPAGSRRRKKPAWPVGRLRGALFLLDQELKPDAGIDLFDLFFVFQARGLPRGEFLDFFLFHRIEGSHVLNKDLNFLPAEVFGQALLKLRRSDLVELQETVVGTGSKAPSF